MNAAALRHLVERAAEVHGGGFPDWFPDTFEWADLCRDAPAMADRLGRTESSAEADRRLESLAEAVFRAAYLSGLSVLSARSETPEDPETIIGRLARRLDEEEEEVFTRLAEGDLAAVESALGDEGEEDAALTPDGREALRLVGVAWPPTADLVGEAVGSAATPGGPEARVLGGIARVAAILASFRWLAADRANEGWPTVLAEEEPPAAS
jgi:hypothetical protein